VAVDVNRETGQPASSNGPHGGPKHPGGVMSEDHVQDLSSSVSPTLSASPSARWASWAWSSWVRSSRWGCRWWCC